MTDIDYIKKSILDDRSWRKQHRPADRAGWELDQEVVRLVKRARTWQALLAVCPDDWRDTVRWAMTGKV